MIPFILKELLCLTQEIENPVYRDQIYYAISYHLSILNKIESSFSIIDKISDFYYYRYALLSLSQIYYDNNFEISKYQDLIIKFLTSSFGRFDNIEKSKMVNKIGENMISIGKIQNAIELSRIVPNHNHKICLYSEISIDFARNGQINDSIIWLNKIASNNDDEFKDEIRKEISNNIFYEIKCETIFRLIKELDLRGNVELTDLLINEMQNLAEKITVDHDGFKVKIKNKLEKYLINRKGILKNKSYLNENIDDYELNAPYFRDDLFFIKFEKKEYLIEILQNELCQNEVIDFSKTISALNYFSIFDLFFGNPDFEKINRYNRTLNIQWAIDIKNSFSEN